MSDPPGTPARRAALRLLTAVLWQGRPLEAAQSHALDGLKDASDRAFARAIASAVLRRLLDLDRLIDAATAKPLPDDARARMVLRLALAQALVLETPPHAVVATALPLVDKGPRRLVHGVLARLLREGAQLPDVPTLPGRYQDRWGRAYGMDATAALAAALAAEPPTDLSVRDLTETERWAQALDGRSLAPGHLRTGRKGAPSDWPGFAQGAWWVQDLAASLPARLLGEVAGRHIVDLCAAPGGKTMQLAAAGASVLAVDLSEARLARLADNLARTKLSADIHPADARKWVPPRAVDDILLDAPCSASGIYRRHPDVLHLKGARELAPLLALQAELLDRAARWLPAHGRLIYCVCSLEPEEGEDQIEAFLARTPELLLDRIEPQELPAGLSPSPPGWVRTLPSQLGSEGGLDGFFIARFRRRAT